MIFFYLDLAIDWFINCITSSKFSFAEETIQFQCRYARTVTTDSTFDVSSLEPQTAVGNGMLAYDLNVNVGGLGGTSAATISPNHSFGSRIYPRWVKYILLNIIYRIISRFSDRIWRFHFQALSYLAHLWIYTCPLNFFRSIKKLLHFKNCKHRIFIRYEIKILKI